MIIDAEDAPKSPVSPHPTFRQNPSTSQSSYSHPVSYSTFSQTHSATSDSRGGSEASTLLYHHQSQSFYDDAQPPAYEEINHDKSKARNRFWTRCAAVFLVICLVYSSWASYRFSKDGKTAPGPPRSGPAQPSTGPKPDVPSTPRNPPRTPPVASSDPPALPFPTRAPLPPLPPNGHLPSEPPFVIPTRGRVDLCHSWAYSMDVGGRPSVLDNRPTDEIEYTVPSLEPLHIETDTICPTDNGSNEFCSGYDNMLDSIAGKLVVRSGDVKLPEIRVTLQHGSKPGLDNISMCLMKKPKNNGQNMDGDSKWVLGLYAWKDRSNDPENYIVVSATIVVTLPKSGVHNLSTALNYFSQSIGPTGGHTNTDLTFDTLTIHATVRGEVLIQNVTAATIEAKAESDNVGVVDCRVSRLVDLTSESGIVASIVTLVQPEGAPPVQMNMRSTYGAVSTNTTLEYSPTRESPPHFEVNAQSDYGIAAVLVNDPQKTQLLYPHQTPPILPIIHVNSTSRLAIAQVVVPPTYHGSVELESQYTSVVIQDSASELPGRIVEWDKRGQVYRGNVRFEGYGREDETGSIHVATQYATSRMLFSGLHDNPTRWPEHEVVVLGRF